MGFNGNWYRLFAHLLLGIGLASNLFAAADDSWDSAFDAQGLNGPVYAIAASGTNVYVGGSFLSAGTTATGRIARWDGNNWSALGSGIDGPVMTIAIAGTNVYVGGDFNIAGGLSAHNIARFDGVAWHALTMGISNGVNFAVHAIAVATNGDVYVVGEFSRACGVPVHNVARYNGTAWSALDEGIDDFVYAVAVDANNSVYAGGSFFGTYDELTELDGFGKWSGSSWSGVGGGVDNFIGFLTTGSNNVIYAGGLFDMAGSATAHNIARLSGSTWSALGNGLSNGFVYGIAVAGTNVYAGGDFRFSGTTSNLNYVARWNGSKWSALGSGLNTSAFAVATSGQDVWVGGAFTIAGGKNSKYFAHWNETLASVTVSVTATDPNAAEAGLDPGTFTVTRTGATTSNLTVNCLFSGSATMGSDYDTITNVVTIPAGSSSAPVTVTSIDDGTVECPEFVVLTLTTGAGYAVGVQNAAAVTIADNDPPTVSIAATDPNASESGPDVGVLTISRTGCTAVPLTVNYSVSGTATPSGDYTALPGAVTLTAGVASTNLVVSPLDDALVESSETVAVTLTADAAYTISGTNATVTIADNDVQSLVVQPTVITVGEGSTNTFTVKLAAQPSSNATVNIAFTSGDIDLSVTGGALLTFTTNNWNVTQSVTISAAEDADTVNGSATFTVSSAGLTDVVVMATEADNDMQGLVVSPMVLSVSEGSMNTFTVRLNAQPPGAVSVTIVFTSGDADLSVTGGASVNFDSGNWNVPQTVTLSAAEDFDAVNGSATFTVSSTGLSNQVVTATESDNDAQGLVVSTASLNVPEGSTNTFTVRLAAQPTNTISVTVSRSNGDTDLSVTGGANLSFNSGDWNVPKVVTLSAAEDADAVNGSAIFSVASSGMSNQTVMVTEVDNDTQVLVVSTNALAVAEGSNAQFTVRLAAQPTNNVGVTATRTAGDTDLSVTGGAALSFTTNNWNTPQPVTVGAAEDADALNGSATITVSSAGLPDQTVTATEADNDTLALHVSTSAITVIEGSTNTFTVSLTAQPTNTINVTVSFAGGDADLSVTGGANLSFDGGDWNVPKIVTLTAAQDADTINGSATFTVAATDLTSLPVTATEADTDALGLVVTPTAINVPEGGANTFTVRLTAQPTGSVNVAIARTSGDSDLTGNTNLTFTGVNWDQLQTVTVRAAEDADAVNGLAIFTVSSTGLTDQIVTATEIDNDTQALILSTNAVTVAEGATGTFTVRLAAQPTNTVGVTATRTAGDTDLSVTGGAALSFTTNNWNTPQPVTVGAAEDADAINNSATITVSSAGLPDQTVTATEADNDMLALQVSTSAITVSEGSTNTFTVKLAAQPASNVTVNIAFTGGDTDLSVTGGAVLTFTTNSWNVAQTVTIAAAEDSDAVNGSAMFTVSSAGLTNVLVTATESDNDTQGLLVSTVALSVPEGSTNTFTVRLTAQPTGTVNVTVVFTSGDADLSITGGASLNFDSGNWNVTQTVTLSAAEDFDTVNGSATFTVFSTGLSNQVVTATESDNDTQGVVVSTASLNVPEGSTNTFTVRLAAQPTNTVSVTVNRSSGDADLSVTGSADLSFSAGDWNIPKVVTLTAVEDVDFINGSAVFTVASSSLSNQTVTATEVDNDAQALVVSTNTLTVAEGGSAQFSVRLAAQPTNSVGVAVTRTAGDTDLSVTGGAALSFTTNNWNTPQPVTVSAAEDADANNGSATITVSSAGLPDQLVTATEADNDMLALQVSTSAVTVIEGSTNTFTVSLNAQPTNTINVTVSFAGGDADLSVTGGANLSFDGGNWNVPQSVTISAAPDADAINGSATITVSASGLLSIPVTATEADTDALGLVVAPMAINLPEGSANTFTVRLTAQPTGSVSVAIARTSGDADLTGNTNLTFTGANWNQLQTVTVSAAEDADAVNGSAIFTVSSTGLTDQNVTASEIDNDAQALILSTNAVTVAEGAVGNFTVRLAAQPTNTVGITVARTAGDTNLNVTAGAALSFTTNNWNVPQTVTLSATEDADALNDSATITVSSTGLPSQTVTAAELDNDSLGIAVSTASISVTEGATNSFTVWLTAQPPADTTVTVAHTSGDTDLSVASGATLTFTPGNWSVPQPVAIAAAQDPDALNGVAIFTVASAGMTDVPVTVTEADDDMTGMVLSADLLNVPESGNATFTVQLAAQPPGNVAVSIARTSGDAALTVSAGANLTFTPSNWSTAQTVTISSTVDADFTNGVAVFTLTAAGSPDRQLTARQIDAGQFIPLAGQYYGLAQEAEPTHATTGFISLKLGSNGAATGKLLFGGASSSFKATFDANGDLAAALPPLMLHLHVAADGSEQMTGTIGNGVFTSLVLAKRAAFSKTVPTSLAGPYTILFSPDTNAPPDFVPQGFGYGTLVVAADGKIKLTGVLADGTKFKPQKMALAKDGSFPCFALLYKGGGSAAGWMTITNIVGESDLNGPVNWFKPASFTETLEAAGSKFTPSPLGLSATTITLGMGNLTSNIVKHAMVDAAGKVTVTDPGDDELKLKITPAKGTFKGSFFHPGKNGLVNVTGVLFQKQQSAAGFFLGPTESGFITIEESP